MDRGLSRFFQQLGTLIFFVLLLYGIFMGAKYIVYSLIETNKTPSDQYLQTEEKNIDLPEISSNLESEYGISLDRLNDASNKISSEKELPQISMNISLPSPEEVKKEISFNQIKTPINKSDIMAIEKENKINETPSELDECRRYPEEFINLVRNNGYKIEAQFFEKPNIKLVLSNASSMQQVTDLVKAVEKSAKNILINVTSIVKKLLNRHLAEGLKISTTNKCKIDIDEKKYNFTFKDNNLIKFELRNSKETFLFSKDLTSENIEALYTNDNGIKHTITISSKSSSISISQNDQQVFLASSFLDKLNKSLIFVEQNRKNILKVNFENGVLAGPASIQNGSDSIETTFINGVVKGVTKVFKSNKLIEETNYNQNIKDGLEKKYKNNSLYRQTTFKDGKITGKDSYFWEASGKIKLETNYLNNLKHGIEEEYNSNGLKVRQTKYSSGIKDGEESVYDENGNLLKKIKYVNGKKHLTLLYKDDELIDVKEHL